jgi:glycyl-tRNA synthetase beta chain
MTAAPAPAAALLVELLTEELPPRALQALSEAFAAGIEKGLRARHFLAAGSFATAFATPRRLAVRISEVAARSADQPLRLKLMPLAVAIGADGRPTAALRRKLASLGHEGLADRWAAVPGVARSEDGTASLQVAADGKAEAVFLVAVTPGSPLLAGLQAALDESLAALPIPKVMSYQLADGATTVQFVRPAHGLVALHGTHVVPVTALGLVAGRTTRGHRFHAIRPIDISAPDHYAAQLEAAHVMPSLLARRERIVEHISAHARRLGAHAVMPAELLDEVAALVEWPVVYEAGFEQEFLQVPQQCLILTMQQNQKYFALKDEAGHLLHRFLLVSNLQTVDPGAIVRGNARVVRARLADARFFFDQDRKATLDSRIPGLAQVVYHNRLGSQLERVVRLTDIAVRIAHAIGADATHVERAAQLAKADLRTLMVGEFPELQGLMGSIYARHDGAPDDVAIAIEEHYRPRFAGGELPTTQVGACVALADKLETLTGLFGIGEKPTGDKDPFGQRRHALGVLRIVLEHKLAVSLPALLDMALKPFAALPGRSGWTAPGEPLAAFFYDRLHGMMREHGYSANEVDAVIQERPARVDLVPQVLEAVRAFARLPEAASLAAANKRIGNILKKADTVLPAFDTALLVEPAEQALAVAFAAVKPVADAQFDRGDYTAMLQALAPLKAPVDRFFDDVMVNVDDLRLRGNRLALLAALRAQMNRVADLSLL